MSQKNLKCTQEACQKKSKTFIFMHMNQLSVQIEQCEECNSGVFKLNAVAAHTYQQIFLLWAEEHNQTIGKLR